MAISSKQHNFDSHNFLKLSFTNIRGLRSNFVDSESFLESNFPDILALCETKLDDLVGSVNFSVRGYLPLIWKNSTTHMNGLAVYVKEGLSFAWDFFLENSYLMFSYLCFLLVFSTGFTSRNLLLLFPLSITFVFMHGVWFYFL